MKSLLKSVYFNLGKNRLIKKIVKPFQGYVQVLMYHRVLPKKMISPIGYEWTVSTERFEEQIRYIAENFTVIPINEILSNEGSEDKKKIIISFDDGYHDNIEYAYPILKKYNIPCIIYVTVNFIEKKSYPWWELLSRLIENNDSIQLNDEKGKENSYILSSLERKRYSFMKLRKLYLDNPEFANSWLKKYELEIPENLFLSKKMLKQISDDRLLSIGAHTMNHPNLKKLPEEEAYLEISKSKTELESCLSRPINHFAYPYGTEKEAGYREFSLAKKSGFVTAVTTRQGKFEITDNMFSIPRFGMSEEETASSLDVKLSGMNNLMSRFKW